MCFGPFSIVVASLGGGDGPGAFLRLFGLFLFGFVGFLILLVSWGGGGGWGWGGGLRFVDVPLPGLFSCYFFLACQHQWYGR